MALTPQPDGPGLNSVLSGTGDVIWGALLEPQCPQLQKGVA